MAHGDHRLGLHLNVSQRQVLTPGLVQMVNLLTLNKLELQEMMQQEMVQNPVLEEATEVVEVVDQEDETELRPASSPSEAVEVDEGETAYQETRERDAAVPEMTADSVPAESTDTRIEDDPWRDDEFQQFENYMNDGSAKPRETEIAERPSFENFLSRPPNLTDHLEWQLGMAPVNEKVRVACHSIIGNLNEDGFLVAVNPDGKEVPLSLEEIAETGGHTVEEVREALEMVQSFDPAGVAARDIRECLMIQLEVLEAADTVAYEIVRDHLHRVELKQFKEIAKAVNEPLDEVMSAMAVIRKLDPRPGQKYNRPQVRHVEPDVFIVKTPEGYKVAANEDELPQLRLSPTYRRMLEKDGLNRDDRNYVKDCFRSALQLLKNVEQRKQIIVKVSESVVRRQGEFLERGIDYLRPMMIKDVAEEVGVHPSTVSRAVANKYAHTPQGMFELREFFSEAVNGPMGAGTSLMVVKRKVKKYIDNENPRSPLTDDKIAALLKDEGIVVTRRSVTKYREDLKIPSTHQRRVRD